MNPQPAVLMPVPPAAHFLALSLDTGTDAARVVDALATLDVDDGLVVGIGVPLIRALGRDLEGLRPFPALTAPGVGVPSTQGALWLYARGADSGIALHRARAAVARLRPVRIDEEVRCFTYEGGRDLTGYEDGTENPTGERAAAVAIVSGRGEGIDGGSFVAVQRWAHDLLRMEAFPREAQDAIIGRSRDTNEELTDAPASAHVKRAAQESFQPAAFMLRRSMPFGALGEHGLYFVAFGASLDPFERVLRRMVGMEDGIADGLFVFSRPLSGGYYFCPPTEQGRLDLRALR